MGIDRLCRKCGNPMIGVTNLNTQYCRKCARERHLEAMRRYYEKNKKKLLDEGKERREWLKEHGICTRCGKEKAIEGQTLCESCKAIRWERYHNKSWGD